MQRIMPHVGKIFFSLFSVAIVVFLLSLSWGALSRIFPTSIVNQLFGLANFDFAALGWLLSFIYVAKGFQQRSIAFVMFLVSIIGTLIIVSLEIGLSTGWFDMAAVMVPLSIVLTVVTFAHMCAIYFFHLNDPDVAAAIESQADEDGIIEQARRDTTAALDALRPGLAAQLARGQVSAALRNLGLPDIVDGRVMAAAPADAPSAHQQEAREAGAGPTGAKVLPSWSGWSLFDTDNPAEPSPVHVSPVVERSPAHVSPFVGGDPESPALGGREIDIPNASSPQA